ncbi:MAG: 50S ribosomal protein L17 [Candidatus Eremiobacteraeota bacterium]|nr:50S ribosomal protein L17 [Candidatus Eremiobacteraeota bacterium]
MKHRKYTRTLGRKTAHRISMLRNLALSLFLHRKIETTHIRALELSKYAEKLVTLAKKGDLESKRRVFAQLRNKEIARQLFDLAKAQYSTRNGGYTRIVKLGFRKGDAAPIVLLELV